MLKRSGGEQPRADMPERRALETDFDSHFFRFELEDGREFSFPINHLVNIQWRPKSPDTSQDAAELLMLSFSTHDVKIEGARLKALRKTVAKGEPVVVKSRDSRYANLETNQPFISGISIEKAGETTE